jgi:hypothetical protein
MTPEVVHLDVLHEGEAKSKANATGGLHEALQTKGMVVSRRWQYATQRTGKFAGTPSHTFLRLSRPPPVEEAHELEDLKKVPMSPLFVAESGFHSIAQPFPAICAAVSELNPMIYVYDMCPSTEEERPGRKTWRVNWKLRLLTVALCHSSKW